MTQRRARRNRQKIFADVKELVGQKSKKKIVTETHPCRDDKALVNKKTTKNATIQKKKNEGKKKRNIKAKSHMITHLLNAHNNSAEEKK